MVRNPIYPRSVNKISLLPEKVDAFVFWTKNPENFIKSLTFLDSKGYFYYFLYTLTPYDQNLEKNLPDKKHLVDNFKKLAHKLGKERVIWRYDPIVLTDSLDTSYHIDRFYKYSSELKDFTSQCITSFMVNYRKCIKNLTEFNIIQLTREQRSFLLKSLSKIACDNKIELTICADNEDFSDSGVLPSCCIKTELINKLTGKQLIYKKDKSQRLRCNCAESVDIGVYNTCLHNCLYCYANYDVEIVCQTIALHDIQSPLMIGSLTGNEIIKER
jgi:hypothetical protein